MPTHSYIGALAFAMSPGIGKQQMEALSVKGQGLFMEPQARICVTVYQDYPMASCAGLASCADMGICLLWIA